MYSKGGMWIRIFGNKFPLCSSEGGLSFKLHSLLLYPLFYFSVFIYIHRYIIFEQFSRHLEKYFLIIQRSINYFYEDSTFKE